MNEDNEFYSDNHESSSDTPAWSEPSDSVYGAAPADTAAEAPHTAYTYEAAAETALKSSKREKKARRGMSAGGIVALCLACALLAGAAGSVGTYFATRNSDSALGQALDSLTPTPVPVISTVSYDGAGNEAAAAIYELAKQQVVGINTTIDYGYNFFGQPSTASVTGSGVIISEDGYILTNYHVVEDAKKGDFPVEVMLYDETSYEAEIVGYDEDNDIALLKIDAVGLSPAQLGNSDDLTVGQTVYAVGNPLGELSYSITGGMVSATDRTITTESNVAVNMFQIDAAVNSGNSGGPVYNAAGQVVGIVTAKYSAAGVEGIGFAIPISDAAHIANQILEHGYVADKAYMGIQCSTVSSAAAEAYDMVEGAYVKTVNEGSAAEKAGLQPGDIITALDGKTVSGSSELTSMVRQYHAGDTAEITVSRDGEEVTLTITFDEKQPEEESEEEQAGSDSASPEPGQDGQYYYYGNGDDMEEFFQEFFDNFGGFGGFGR
jgi:serine protease Do